MRRATRDGRSLSCTRQRERNIDLTRVPARERSRAGMGGALGVIVSSRRDAQRRQKAVGRRLGDPRHQRRAPRQRHLSHSAVPAQGSGPDGRALTPWFTRKKNGAALSATTCRPARTRSMRGFRPATPPGGRAHRYAFSCSRTAKSVLAGEPDVCHSKEVWREDCTGISSH